MSSKEESLRSGATPAAMAFQIAVALESYQQDLDHFVSAPLESGLLRVAGDSLERMKSLVGTQPDLTLRLLELIISHAEVTQAYGKLTSERKSASDLTVLFQHHCARIESMRHRCCLQMVQSP